MDQDVLKSDMESVAYMLGYKSKLARSPMSLEEKCLYLESKVKQSLFWAKMQFFLKYGQPTELGQGKY